LCAEAESQSGLPFDIVEFRVHHLEPHAAPGDLADGHELSAAEESHSIAEHRADAVDAPAPRERRVAPSKSNLHGAGRGLNRESVPPAIVLYAADSTACAGDEAPTMPTPADGDLSTADEHSVSQDAELRLDDHGLDIEAWPHKRSRGIPVRKPLNEGFPCGPLHALRSAQPHPVLTRYPRDGSFGRRPRAPRRRRPR